MNFLELCQTAVAIDSTPGNGTNDIAAFYGQMAKTAGLEVDLIDDQLSGVAQKILIIRPRQAQAKSDLLLVSQLDTPNPGNFSRWTKTGGNPFSASVIGADLIGLGVSRAKVDFLAKLMVVQKFSNHKFGKLNPVLVGSFGEESGACAVRLIRKKILNPKAAVVCAPSSFRPGISGPGYATLEVFVPFSKEEKQHHRDLESAENSTTQTKMFTAKKQIGSSAEHDEGPIGQMLEYLRHLPEGMTLISMSGGEHPSQPADSAWLELELNDRIKDSSIRRIVLLRETLQKFTGALRSVKDASFTPPHSTINIGAVRTRPDGICFLLSCRFVPSVSGTHYQKWLAELETECESKGADFELLEYRAPFFTPDSSWILTELKSSLRDAGFSDGQKAVHWCTDANVLARFGVDTVVFGAGDLQPGQDLANESISIAKMESLQSVYEKLLERVSL